VKKIIPLNQRIMTAPLILGHTNKVTTSRRAQVLGAHFDADGILHLSFVGDPDADQWDDRRFVTKTSSLRLPHALGRLAHVAGPIMGDGDTWYVFEVDSPEDSPRPGASRAAGVVVNQQSGPVSGLSVQAGAIGGGISRGVYIQ
jgi:hypothetical protein